MEDAAEKAKVEKFIAALDSAVSSCSSSVCQYFTMYAIRAAAQNGEEELKSLIVAVAKLEARDAAMDSIAERLKLKAQEN